MVGPLESLPPGILIGDDILAAVGLCRSDDASRETHQGLIRPCRRENVRTAGYDLRLGDEYFLQFSDGHSEQVTTSRLPTDSIGIEVPPNSVVYVVLLEELHLPADIVGHVSLKLDLLLQGLIMPSQSQIDAGYGGRLFILLYNLSERPVLLKRRQRVVRLELVKLHSETWMYRGDYSGRDLSEVMPRPVRSSLNALSDRVDQAIRETASTREAGKGEVGHLRERLNDELRRFERLRTLAAAIIAIVTVALAVLQNDLGARVASMEATLAERERAATMASGAPSAAAPNGREGASP